MSKSKDARFGKRFRRWLEKSWLLYAAFASTVWVFDHVPRVLGRALGRLGGWMASRVDSRNVQRAMDNLAIAFPDWDARRRRDTVTRCYMHLGQCMTDVCRFRSLSKERLLSVWIDRDPESERVLTEALAEGKGMVGVGAHTGFWELSAFAYSAMGYKSVCVSNRLPAPRINDLVQRIRARFGNVIVHQEGALIHLLRALKNGQAVGIIMDHWGESRSPLVPFFGRETRTVDTVARLHRKTGAPVVSNMMLRRPDGRYVWRFKRIAVPPADGLTEEEHIRAILLACNQDIEAAIREYPEQWTWMHKRWR
jgi:Kdo2-lipid IVA lauroyltransferase/acyltransferase